MKKMLKILAIVLMVFVGIVFYLLNDALIIGSGYTAKYLCSQVFMAERDADRVFAQDVAPTHPLFRFVSHRVNTANLTVTAKAFGFLSPATAVYREGCGCTLAVNTSEETLAQQCRDIAQRLPRNETDPWPRGEKADSDAIPANVDQVRLQAFMQEAFQEPSDTSLRNTQAIVVVYKDRIIAEKYQQPFTKNTPILGWSMTKSVTNALMGILVRDGRFDILQPAPVKAWQSTGDERGKITLDQMLRMSSGLDFQEVYAPFKDATDMLYNSKSMADFAAAKSLRVEPDDEWYYSSGTSNILARIVRDAVGGTLADVLNFAQRELFDPIGMVSALIEADASGSLVGSSYMYATARDWARYGVFIKNDGVWNGNRILPEGWVRYSLTPTPLAPKGEYGAHFWLNAGAKDNPQNRQFPSLPPDMAYLSGFNLQIVAIIPSRDIVIVRLGATHDDSWSHEKFIGDVLTCISN